MATVGEFMNIENVPDINFDMGHFDFYNNLNDPFEEHQTDTESIQMGSKNVGAKVVVYISKIHVFSIKF